jgi:hypothetical protein
MQRLCIGEEGMRGVRIMTRPHLFEDRLDLIKQYADQYELYHEKSTRPVVLIRRPRLDLAFWDYNWEVFEAAEAEYFATH